MSRPFKVVLMRAKLFDSALVNWGKRHIKMISSVMWYFCFSQVLALHQMTRELEIWRSHSYVNSKQIKLNKGWKLLTIKKLCMLCCAAQIISYELSKWISLRLISFPALLFSWHFYSSAFWLFSNGRLSETLQKTPRSRAMIEDARECEAVLLFSGSSFISSSKISISSSKFPPLLLSPISVTWWIIKNYISDFKK